MKTVYTVICFMLLTLSAHAGQDIITVNYPPDMTVMEFNLLSISLTVDRDNADLIKVTVNDKETTEIIPDIAYECFSVELIVGINMVKITAIKDNEQVDEIIMSVFRRSDLESAYKDPPDGFKKTYFHAKDHLECAACHNLQPGMYDRKSVDITAFPTDKLIIDKKVLAETSTCYSCHKSLVAYPFVHGPSAVWSCLSCHDPETEPVYNVKKPYPKICYGCHKKQKEEREHKKYFHGPVTTGQCTICHNPHAAENTFNLIKSIWNLCTSCHIEKGSGIHIVSFFPGAKSHPTRGKPDPLRKGKELSCTSCHDPHASDSPRLWKMEAVNGFALCRKCHAD